MAEETVKIPKAQGDRVALVGRTVVHPTRWHAGTAEGTGISRSSIYRYLLGRKAWMRGVDGRLLEFMAWEKAAAKDRARRIGALEKAFKEWMGSRT